MAERFADKVAQLCYEHFEKLPKTGKPQIDKEWSILSAILLQKKSADLQIVTIATGSKCLGQNLLSSKGDLVNDSHAEILVRRGLLRYIHHQLLIANTSPSSIFTQDPIKKKFHLKKEFSFIFFSSHTPCGDASIIPKVDSSVEEVTCCEALPSKIPRLDDLHRTGAKCTKGGPQDPKFPGIDHHITGVLRTKPGRGDQTLSMSCSDKLAKWNILGLQGSLLMNVLAEPIYLSQFIIGKCPYSQEAMERALSKRFSEAESLHPLFKQQKDLVISQSQFEFKFCKPIREQESLLQPCPSSIIWTACPFKPLEVSVDGAKQGVTKKNRGKPSCSLEICKKKLFQSFISLLKKLESSPDLNLENLPYYQAKKLAVDYCKSWQMIRESVMPNWTCKPSTLAEFTVND